MTDPQKAVLSNRLYFRPTDNNHLREIISQLTYKIEKKTSSNSKFKNIELIKNYKLLPKGLVSVPQGRTDLLPPGIEIIDKRVYNPVPFPLPLFPLRDSQQPVFDEVKDTCFINALVGWGKCFAL